MSNYTESGKKLMMSEEIYHYGAIKWILKPEYKDNAFVIIITEEVNGQPITREYSGEDWNADIMLKYVPLDIRTKSEKMLNRVQLYFENISKEDFVKEQV